MITFIGCTKARPFLYHNENGFQIAEHRIEGRTPLNGDLAIKCDISESYLMKRAPFFGYTNPLGTCLEYDQLEDYGKGRDLHGLRIDNPKLATIKLTDLYADKKMSGRITAFPQSYRFGYMLAYQQDVPVGETIVPLTSGACLVKVLILSVHSQYCELIGNERKWYEVRTKLPKGIVEVK